MEERENDIDFVQGGIMSYEIGYNNLCQEWELTIIVEKENHKVQYNPFQYLRVVKGCYYKQIDLLKKEQLNERITKVYDAKAMVLRLIEEFQNEFDRTSNKPKKVYDYSNVLNEINSTIEKIRLEIEVKKLDLELTWGKWIPRVSIAISILALVFSIYKIIHT